MADKMTRNGFGVVLMSVWHAVITLVMLPTLLIQWLTGTPTTKPLPRKMSENGQSTNGNADGPLGLTERELKMIKVSWDVLAEDKKSNGVKFFMTLFTIFPTSKDLFKHFKDVPLDQLKYDGETTKSNKKMVAHAMSVMYALESYVDSLDDAYCLEELVKKVAISHKPRGIGPDKFKLLTPVLHAVIEDLVKDDDSVDLETIKSGWTKLIDTVCDIVEKAQKEV
ncbi:globin-2 B chain-like isoform X2 [Mizuhopecten yessoensis]|uniref:globin-2 B chain-like isoform X2 n=1 Tax=Mizuhopecten yessoensis TaxID=6573 RepID=UPI000B459E61|nr:globin-2 B chain-like isoform X2 [Mizuhopecten yessoensis]